MANASDGMTYNPGGQSKPVVEPGEFMFGVAHLDHAHIDGMTTALESSGARLKSIYEPNREKAEAFQRKFPHATIAGSLNELLNDPEVRCVAAAAIPNERCALGMKVMDAGKDYFTDKCPFTTLDQLGRAREKASETGRKYMVYFSERLHNAPTYFAGELARSGAIGKVLKIMVMAPHRLSKGSRPEWFFQKQRYGGIITDIGSHQFEQLLHFTGATDGVINFSRVENFNNPDKPELEDFGETSLTMNNGASCYCRIDWFTPDAARAWGDGRLFALGTDGYIEVRKYLDVGRPKSSPSVFWVNREEEQERTFEGPQHFPFFGELVLDMINRTEKAMTQEHAFKAAELSLLAQKIADERRGSL